MEPKPPGPVASGCAVCALDIRMRLPRTLHARTTQPCGVRGRQSPNANAKFRRILKFLTCLLTTANPRLTRINHQLRRETQRRRETPCSAGWSKAGAGLWKGWMRTYRPHRNPSPTPLQPASRKSQQMAGDFSGLMPGRNPRAAANPKPTRNQNPAPMSRPRNLRSQNSTSVSVRFSRQAFYTPYPTVATALDLFLGGCPAPHAAKQLSTRPFAFPLSLQRVVGRPRRENAGGFGIGFKLSMRCYPFGYQGPALSAPPTNRSEADFSNEAWPQTRQGVN